MGTVIHESEIIALSCDSGYGENSVDNPLITPEMLKEEEKLQKDSERKAQKLRKDYEKEQHAKEMKELRYKRLIALLEKSQFYANFMHEKVSHLLEDGSDSKNKGKNKNKSKRKRENLTETYNEDLINACKKHKSNDGKAENIPSNININIQCDNEDRPSEAAMEGEIEEKKDEVKGTRVTSLGIEVPADQPVLLEGASLRDYQMEGLKWMRVLFESGLNGILADEMGLGKTVQIISLICHLYEQNVPGPFLVVGPLSTLPNWSMEFANFAPQVPVVLYHGSESDRTQMRRRIAKKIYINGKKAYPVVLTSYEIPARDNHYMKDIRWRYIIVDEGHRLKNYKSQLSRTLSSFSTVNRLLLTGTPLQNNLIELWSLLNFLMPEVFDSIDAFQSWFQVEDIERADVADKLVEQEKKDQILVVLHKILNPFVLRRVKSEVNLYLPPKKELIVYCPLTDTQRKLYEALLDNSILNHLMRTKERHEIIPDNPDGTKVKRRSALRPKEESHLKSEAASEHYSDLVVVNTDAGQYRLNVKVLNMAMMLRKTVNHPYLVQRPVLPGSNILKVDEELVQSSGKLIMVDGLLKRLKKNNHKVLIFSTFTTILDLLEEYMVMRDFQYERLDGNNKLEERKQSIKRFNQDENCFVFLISTRAGGLGINLTAADTVIIFDSDWNPQADLQAQDRCHRIGQVRPVIVYRLVAKGTVDEKIVARADAKRKLEKIIIQGGNFSHSKQSEKKSMLDYEELKALLNDKQHGLEIHPDGSVLSNEQWEALLDRTSVEETSNVR